MLHALAPDRPGGADATPARGDAVLPKVRRRGAVTLVADGTESDRPHAGIRAKQRHKGGGMRFAPGGAASRARAGAID